jgi:hypothetical protein
MIFIQFPVMVLVLIPVIVVEALLIRRWVSLTHRDAFWGVTKANVISTLLGVPAAWLAMLIVDFIVGIPLLAAADRFHWNADSLALKVSAFFITAAWIDPAEDRSAVFAIAAAYSVLLVPSFYASVLIERWICLKAWPNADGGSVRRGVFFANIASYGVLLALACACMAYELVSRRR